MSPARVIRCGERKLPVLSITMRNGIVKQNERFSKSIASIDKSNYKVVKNGQLVIAFPIDEGLLYTQDVVSEGIMSPAYNIWDVDYSCINRRFLVTFFHSSFAFAYYKAKLKGTTQRRRVIDKSDLLSMPIPVPPIGEQERIVAELDLLQGIIEKKKEQLKAYDQLAQSIFYTMFGDPIDNPKRWETKKLGELASLITDGDWIESKDQSDNGIRLIQTGNIGSGFFIAKDDKPHFISEKTFYSLGCTEVFVGDCLISRLPSPVGRACLIPKTDYRMITAVDCSIVRFKDIILPQFFINYSLSSCYQAEIDRKTTGTTRKRISRKNLERIPVPLPPLSLQEEFAEKIEAIERQKALVQQSIDETQTMFDYTMDKYFG